MVSQMPQTPIPRPQIAFRNICTPDLLSKGLSWLVSAEQCLVRNISLIMPRMKCCCPDSASTMIGHAPSVERLYPTVGKHELQGSLCPPKFGFGHERAGASLNFVGIFIDR